MFHVKSRGMMRHEVSALSSSLRWTRSAEYRERATLVGRPSPVRTPDGVSLRHQVQGHLDQCGDEGPEAPVRLFVLLHDHLLSG